MRPSDTIPHTLEACPLCASRDRFVPHRSGAPAIAQCPQCGLVMRQPQPSDAALRAIYGPGYFFGAGDREMEAATSALKSATADAYLDAIDAYRRARPEHGAAPRLLDVGCGHGDLLARARARGYEVHGTDVSADAVARVTTRLGAGTATCDTAGDFAGVGGRFDVCVLSDVIEHARDPGVLLRHVRRVLEPGATVLITTPSIAHWTARLLNRHWMEFKEEHLYYFDPRTIRRLLLESGYDDIVIGPNRKTLSLDYLGAHFRRFHVPLLKPAIGGLQRVLPPAWRRRAFALPTGGMTVLARPRAPHAAATPAPAAAAGQARR